MSYTNSNRKGIAIKCCPLCGGEITVNFLYYYAHERDISKRHGRLKKEKRVYAPDCTDTTAYCANFNNGCSAYWKCESGVDDFEIVDDKFIDYKYSGGN